MKSKISFRFFGRFRIVTWNVGNSEPDCNTFEQLAFTSVMKDFQADLIAFGYRDD
jgi:hypothetical protein